MKKLINVILFVSILFFCVCCKEDKEEDTNENGVKLEIYYSYKDSDKQLISQNDTITVNLGDTLSLFVEVTGEYFGLWGDKSLEIQETGNREYSCVTKKTGIATIGSLAYGDTEISDELLFNFFVKVPSITYSYIVFGDPTFVIDIGNENLKNVIQTELEDSCILAFFSYYKLECNTINGGSLLYRTASADTIMGTFSSSNIYNMTDITMNFNGSTYNFTSEEDKESKLINGYLLKLDLTEKFRAKYPAETINEVSITALTKRSK